MRINCELDGVGDVWLELEPRFTRRDVKALEEAEEEQTIAMIRERLTACHIPTEGGAIDSPEEFTGARLEDADVAVIAWLGAVLPTVIGYRRALGNASLRLSSGSNGSGIVASKSGSQAT